MRANNLRKGNVIIYKGDPHKIIEFTHVTPGKGQAVVQTKLRNLVSGVQTENRFGATESVDLADMFTFKATYLYSDGDSYHFMNSDNYEQFTLTKTLLDDAIFYLQDNMEITVTTFNEDPIGIELPQTVVLTVAETEPELKGATASNSPKPAVTDTGLSLSVPPFVKIGDKIKVHTGEGRYLERADE